MSYLRVVPTLCSALLLSGALGLGSTRISAQNPAGQPEGVGTQVETVYAGTAAYNVMKTENVAIGLLPVAANAFVPTTLPCPASSGANGCTFRITVSSQFWNIDTNVGQAILTVTGPGTLGPSSLVNIVSGTSATLAETHTMVWVKRNIPPGTSPTVTVQFQVNGGVGFAGFRTMSIDVFNGLI